MYPDADVIADIFDLGLPSDGLTALTGGSSARRWVLDTDRGRWMVKGHHTPTSWQLQEMRVSGMLELAAHAAGVSMSRPILPRTAAVGLWAAIDELGGFVRVSAWLEGVPPSPAHGALLAGWLGRTLAIIDGLRLPGDPTTEAAYPIHDTAEWRCWLDEAASASVLDRTRLPVLRAAIADATAVIRSAMATGPAFQLAHRDMSRRNILLTADGPALIDFDYAGPEVSWWEFVHHAFDLASPELGRHAPAPGLVRSALAAYVTAGATPGPARPEAFAGLLRATLNAAAYNLWLAVGHRPVDADRRAAAAATSQDLAARLPVIVNSIANWTQLIG
jgi:hypothetical protein